MNEAEIIQYFRPLIGEEEIKEVVNTLKSGWFTTGPKTAKFEKLINEYIGSKEAVCVASCTAALHISLLSMGIGSHDEVITSPFTFASTGNEIVHVGAKPVFVDIKTNTYNIDSEKIEKAITSRTKAIMPVHYAGQPCDMEEIMAIARKHNLYVIEDAAHAVGAEYHGRKIGLIGDAACFSFASNKNMTTGDGGAIVTANKDLADSARLLSSFGITKDSWKRYLSPGSWSYDIEVCGWKYNMTDIASALGIWQLRRLDRFIETRSKYYQIYNKELGKIEGIITPYEEPDIKQAHHLYPILIEKLNRDDFIKRMAEKGILCSVHFIPLHLHPFYRDNFGFRKGDFPNAEWVYQREVSLPLYPKMSSNDVYRVITAVRATVEELTC